MNNELPVPNIPKLIEFLANISLKKPIQAQEYLSEIVNPFGRTTGVDSEGNPINGIKPEIRIWHKEIDDFTFNSLIGVVESRIKKHGHTTNHDIASAIIGLFLNLHPKENYTEESLYKVLDSITTSSVKLYFVLPKLKPWRFPSELSQFTFGPYSFGKMKLSDLRRECNNAKSDYFVRYERTLKDRLSITREFSRVSLIDWSPFQEERKFALKLFKDLEEQYVNMMNNYFEQMNYVLFDQFFRGIGEEQQISMVYGDTYLDERTLELVPGTNRIAVFRNVDGGGEYGFVQDIVNRDYVLEIAGIDRRLPETLSKLQDEFNLTEIGPSMIHQTLKSFSSFISKAKIRQWDGNLDEAFLHFMISLDLLLGGSDRLSESVSRRVAVLIGPNSQEGFSNQTQVMRRLYRERSKYVHEGVSPQENSLSEIEEICKGVLLCILHLQKDEDTRAGIDVSEWITNIDLIGATLEAGREPERELLESCGISS